MTFDMSAGCFPSEQRELVWVITWLAFDKACITESFKHRIYQRCNQFHEFIDTPVFVGFTHEHIDDELSDILIHSAFLKPSSSLMCPGKNKEPQRS